MSDTGQNDGLDFDKAEFQQPASASCAVCSNAIRDTYFEANGKLVCERCQAGLSEAYGRPPDFETYARGLGFGVVAAIAGSIVWALITNATGYAIGLVAIGVAWLVGKAIGKGTGQRGGVPMQLAAVVLTYLAIVGQSVPDLLLRMGSDRSLSTLLNVMVMAVQVPILRGADGIIGLVIIGFALWEAWRHSASIQFQFNGPFRLSDRSTSSAA